MIYGVHIVVEGARLMTTPIEVVFAARAYHRQYVNHILADLNNAPAVGSSIYDHGYPCIVEGYYISLEGRLLTQYRLREE